MAPMTGHLTAYGSAPCPSTPLLDHGPGGTVSSRTERGRVLVELHGEIDLAVVVAAEPRLRALTGPAGGASRGHLVADLRQVTFIDCSGLALLVDVRDRVLAGGGRFTLVCDDRRILRLLRITGLATVLAPVGRIEDVQDEAATEDAAIESAAIEDAAAEDGADSDSDSDSGSAADSDAGTQAAGDGGAGADGGRADVRESAPADVRADGAAGRVGSGGGGGMPGAAAVGPPDASKGRET
ncbi:STAS domain-containing protein [Streptomyces sp. NRRL S-1868]|uniref:STAS domain-containing protein n=1 Tax=Streptomyces sp. NRRL S-1868 TaxID=1463892 RepID=UPI00099D7D8D|nr:STAS domain-containing protein [Streptomyces sp. NRRL S-1868]